MSLSFTFNPLTGNLDLIDKGGTTPSIVDAARAISCEGIAGEDISALQLVRLTDADTFRLADNALYTTAACVGVAITAATTGNELTALLFGRLEDASFTFPVNEPLFLSDVTTGLITGTEPTTDHLVRIGQSLGTGAIFIDIEDPVVL